jgi:hypothetical protein
MRRNRREAGEGNFGCLVGIILLLAAVFVAYKMIPLKVRAAELRQVIQDEAKSAGTHSDERIKKAILLKADENRLPVTEDNIQISRKQNDIWIDVEYTVPVKFPGFTYQWKQHHHYENPIF